MKSSGLSRLARARLHAAIASLPTHNQFGRALLLGLALGASSAQAATYTWDLSTTAGTQTGDGTWSTGATNWSTNGTTLSGWLQTNGTTALHTAVFAGADGAYNITLGSAIAAQTLTFSNSGYTLSAASAQTLTLTNVGNGVIGVAAGKSGTIGNNVTVAFNAANNTGARIDLTTGGTLDIASGATVTRTGQVTTGFSATGGTLGFMGSGTINVAGTLSFNVATPVGNGGIVIAANQNNVNTLNVNGGTVSSNSTINGIALVAAGNTPSGTSGTLNVNSGLVSTTGTAGATSGINIANGAGSTGTVNLNGGTISTYQINSNYLNGSNALSTGGTSTFNFNGGTLKAIANNASFMGGLTAANVKSGGATVDSNGFNVTIAQPLLDGTGGGGLAKNGTGTLTLSGASTYVGATSVNAGTLAVNGSLTSNISVAGGAGLSGTGSTTGSVSFASGSSFTVNPADSFAANGVDFAGSTTLNFSSALTSGNTYNVVDFGSGSLTGLANVVKTVRGTFGTAGTILQFTAGTVSTDTWNTTSGTWQVGTTTPWSNGSDNEFWNGDTVIFNDTPGANTAVTISGSVAPAAITVNNSTVSYAWSGSGSISGSGSLTKDGSNSLTIATANTYSGGTTLNAGTLVVNNASALGSGALNIAGGTLDSTTGATLSTNNAVNVTGDFSYLGTSNLSLGTGAVTLTGDRTVTVDAGTLGLGRLVAGGSFTKNGAGTLTLNPTGISTVAGQLNVNAGTLNIGAQDLTATGLGGSGTIANGSALTRWLLVTNATDNTFDGVLQDGGGAGKLGFSKSGVGAMTLTGANTLSDVVTVNDGVLRFGGAGSLANASSYAINNNGVLQVSANGQLGSGPISINSGGGAVGTANRLEISGNTTVGGAITLAQRNEASSGAVVANDAIRSTGGNNTLSGAITITTGGNQARIQSNAGSLTLSGAITTSATTARNLYLQGAANGTVSGIVSDNAGNAAGKINVWKDGAGAWTLSGANTYTGTTTVSAGTLFVNGSLASGSTLTVASGATLGGTGIIGGPATVNGILSAGNSPGVLTFSGNLSLGSGSTSKFEINGAGRGTGYDGVDVGGVLTYGGTLDLIFDAPITAGTYDLFSGAFTSSGDFGSVSLSGLFAQSITSGPAFAPGVGWTLSTSGYSFSFDNVSGDLTVSAVPEPSAFAALVGVVGLGAAALRRRRRT